MEKLIVARAFFVNSLSNLHFVWQQIDVIDGIDVNAHLMPLAQEVKISIDLTETKISLLYVHFYEIFLRNFLWGMTLAHAF